MLDLPCPPSAPATSAAVKLKLFAVALAFVLALPSTPARAQAPSERTAEQLVTHAKPVDGNQLRALPPGIFLPVALGHTLRAGSTPAGTPAEAFTTQRVPVAPGQFLPRGVALLGTVVASVAGSGPATLTLRFTTLRYAGHEIPITVAALAVANITDVNDTFAPMTVTGDPSDTSRANWTTMQVGGDVVMRSGWSGPVLNQRTQRVGFADFHGVYADAAATAPAATARRTAGANAAVALQSPDLPRALGVFSADARGLYGFADDNVLLSGAQDFTVTAPHRLELRANANLLLQVR